MKISLFLLFAAIIVSFYRLPRSIFDADKEYFAISGKKILSGDVTLIGQQTGIGELYHAPLFNYLVAAALWILKGNPLVISGIGALFAVATVPAIFLLGSQIISRRGAFLAALIALLSTEFLGLQSITENVSPLTLLTLLFLWVLIKFQSGWKRSLLLGSLSGLTLHFHVIGAMSIVPLLFIGFQWIPTFVLFASPLVLFDIRNDFLITRHALAFFGSQPSLATSIPYRIHTYFISLAELIHSGASATFYIPLVLLVTWWGITRPFISHFIKLLLVIPLVFFLFYSRHLVPYYSIISWMPFLLVFGEFLARLYAQKRALLFFSIIVYFFLLSYGKIQQLVYWDPLRTIDKKLAALRYIKSRVGEQDVYISRTMEFGTNFGFDYLISYVGIHDTKNSNDPTYTLVIPARWQGIQPDVQFGDIGVVLPHE